MSIATIPLEQQLLGDKRLARWQVQEIRRMFDMADADGSGELSPGDVALLLQRICKGSPHMPDRIGSTISEQDVLAVFQKIGSVRGNSVSWDEFLQST